MKLSVFDNDVEALSQWRRLATDNSLLFAGHTNLDPLPNTLSGDSQLIVLDQSLVEGDLVNRVAALCQENRQHLFLVSGANLTIHQVVQLMKIRANWVFEKPLVTHQVQPILEQVIDCGRSVADSLGEYRRLQSMLNRLTSREKEVLDLVLKGVPNKDAAAKLNISIRTVEARRAKVYLKTENDNIANLVRMVERIEQLHERFTPTNQKSKGLHHHFNRSKDLDPTEGETGSDVNCATT